MRRADTLPGVFITALVGCVLAATGCEDEEPPGRCPSTPAVFTAEGVVLENACGQVTLLPSVLIDGQWRGAGDDGPCEATGETLRCPAGELGELEVERSDVGAVVATFTAASPVTISGLALVGAAELEGASSWLSNGFQSWSQSGFVALEPAPEAEALAEELALRGDPESTSSGALFSEGYTVVGGGGDQTLLAGALEAARLHPWVQASQEVAGGEVALRLVSGAAGEQVALAAGEALSGEPFLVELGDDPGALMSAYGRQISTRRGRAGAPARPELGWNSWYELWDGVDEEAVRENAALLEDHLGAEAEARGLALRVVVDDGWQQAWGDWQPNEKFPSGMEGLATDLIAEGFTVGIWLAPLLAHEDSAVVGDHPDWFLPEATYHHMVNGAMRILDVTHPGAAEHLASVITTIVGWGYSLLKIDFLFAGTFEDTRGEPVTATEAYHRAMEIIRRAAGEETILLAVGAPPLPSFPHVDAWRLGADIAFEPFGPSWFFMINQGRSLGVRWPLCLATLCDPDPPLLRDLSAEEVGTGAWIVALAGGGLFLSDDLRQLPPERLDWLTGELLDVAMSGAPSLPIDQIPPSPPTALDTHVFNTITDRNTQVLPTRWRTAAGFKVLLNPDAEAAAEISGLEVPPRGARVIR